MADYYIKIGDDVYGPASADKLKSMAREGRLAGSCMIRRGLNGSWHSAESVKGLFPTDQIMPLDAIPESIAPPVQVSVVPDTVETNYRPVHRAVQTIEKTGKTWKLLMLIGILAMFASCGGFFTSAAISDTNGSGSGGIASAIALLSLLGFLVGAGVYFYGRFGAWWYHD
jgi:hypothetical protein